MLVGLGLVRLVRRMLAAMSMVCRGMLWMLGVRGGCVVVVSGPSGVRIGGRSCPMRDVDRWVLVYLLGLVLAVAGVVIGVHVVWFLLDGRIFAL